MRSLLICSLSYLKFYCIVLYSTVLHCITVSHIKMQSKRTQGSVKGNTRHKFKKLTQVIIKYGIYEGDVLSPLLLCIGLNFLSWTIRKIGYKFKSEITVSHLLYMNVIKLYAKSEQDIDLLICLTWIYREDIGMSFRLEKHSQMVVKREKIAKKMGWNYGEYQSYCHG